MAHTHLTDLFKTAKEKFPVPHLKAESSVDLRHLGSSRRLNRFCRLGSFSFNRRLFDGHLLCLLNLYVECGAGMISHVNLLFENDAVFIRHKTIAVL